MAIKQTAGREALGKFAPKFAELNDDVLFGQELCLPPNLRFIPLNSVLKISGWLKCCPGKNI